eukprot:1157715-Pelagomonas_calceolata.AAC.1
MIEQQGWRKGLRCDHAWGLSTHTMGMGLKDTQTQRHIQLDGMCRKRNRTAYLMIREAPGVQAPGVPEYSKAPTLA